MARTDPRPHTRTGANLTCAHCGATFYAPASDIKRGKRYCSSACYFAVKAAAKKTLCAACGVAPRFPGQAYCAECGLKKNAEWRQANRTPKSGVARANVTPQTEEQRRAARAAWRKKSMDKILMWNRLRRHRERAAGKPPTRHDVGALICEQDASCAYCLTLFVPGAPFEIDHILPVSRGGTNDLDNIQLVCPTCNMRKGAKTHEEFLAWMAERTLARMSAGILDLAPEELDKVRCG